MLAVAVAVVPAPVPMPLPVPTLKPLDELVLQVLSHIGWQTYLAQDNRSGPSNCYSLTTTPGGRQEILLLEAWGSKKTINLTKKRALNLRIEYGLSIIDISDFLHIHPLQVKEWIDA